MFLDADVLPIRPLSHLFTLPHEFAAVPDVGWPDIFNSGVLLLTPGEAKFTELNELLKTKGSWDGGDQGLLNEWRGDDWHRLSFTYNTTPTAAYTSVILPRRCPRFQLIVSLLPSVMHQLTSGMVPKSQLYTLSDRTNLGTLLLIGPPSLLLNLPIRAPKYNEPTIIILWLTDGLQFTTGITVYPRMLPNRTSTSSKPNLPGECLLMILAWIRTVPLLLIGAMTSRMLPQLVL